MFLILNKLRALSWFTAAKCVFVCVVFACEFFSPVHAATLVYDDFNDGNFRDNDPARWNSIFGAAPVAVDGDVHLPTNSCCPGFGWSQSVNGDVSIQTQFQIQSNGFGVAAKFGGGNGNDGYYWDLLSSGGLLFLARVNGIEYRHDTGVLVDVPRDEDVVMQLDVVGNRVAGWYWTESTQPPALPQLDLTLEHQLIDSGIAGIYSSGPSTLRYIHIADSPIAVPEPSSVLLVCVGLLGISCLRKRRRHTATVATLMAPIAISLACCVPQSASAQTILLDDFSSPDLAGWFNTETYSEKPWGPGILEVRDGELFYGTTGTVPTDTEPTLAGTGFALSQWNASSVDPAFNNGTLRAKVRAEAPAGAAEAGNVAMYVRGDLSTLTAYVVGAIGSNKAFVLDKFVNGTVAEQWAVEGIDFTLNEDWFMELGAIGSELSVKVWKASDVEPLEPQLSIMDTDIPSGTIGLTAAMSPAVATEAIALNTYYDDVTFTVPEPSSLSLLVFATLLTASRFRVKRKLNGTDF